MYSSRRAAGYGTVSVGTTSFWVGRAPSGVGVTPGSTGVTPGSTGDAPGGPSRWSTERTAEWVPLKPELVIEVRYDQVTAGRFRHGVKLVRWRPDKAPRQCTCEQIKPRRFAKALASG